MEWISVKDRLPAFELYSGDPLIVAGQDIPPLYRSERVLYVAEGTIFVGRIEKLRDYLFPNGTTHWMPLPAPPIESESV